MMYDDNENNETITRPKKIPFLKIALSLVILSLVFAFGGWSQSGTEKSEEAELFAPVGLSIHELGQWCIDRKAQGTTNLSQRARTWLDSCIEAFGAAQTSSPPTTTAPVPTTTTITPTPTTPAPTTSSTTLPPTTTNPPPPPTTTPPAPTPTPTGTLNNCLNQLAACGLPHSGNTGPNGTLTVSTRTQYNNSGELIQNVEIRGCIDVNASNVTFRNVRFVGNGCHYLVRNNSSGLRFEDTEANCNDGPNSAMAGPGGFIVLRADIHDCENGFDVQSNNVTLQDSWIHNMYDGGDAHTDGLQFGQGASNIQVIHNSIIMSLASNAATIMWDEAGAQNNNVLFDRNLMSGANYTLRCARFGTSINVVITNNRFGPNVPGYDHTDSCVGSHVTTWSNNRVDATGALLAAS